MSAAPSTTRDVCQRHLSRAQTLTSKLQFVCWASERTMRAIQSSKGRSGPDMGMQASSGSASCDKRAQGQIQKRTWFGMTRACLIRGHGASCHIDRHNSTVWSAQKSVRLPQAVLRRLQQELQARNQQAYLLRARKYSCRSADNQTEVMSLYTISWVVIEQDVAKGEAMQCIT